jgi:pyruvate formate lyase activating enzyme
MKTKCTLCPRGCVLGEGKEGFCGGRGNVGGEITSLNYGRISAIMLDPVLKKPLKEFHPDSYVLSVGSYGCNLTCPFCQNYHISQEGKEQWVEATGKYYSTYETILPKALVALARSAKSKGNIGIAYTYNEPLVGYEYVWDVSGLVRQEGLKNILVTNGCFQEEAFREMAQRMDAMNIDIKSFRPDFYKKIGGDLSLVLSNVREAVKHCHVEITTLIIPGENDSPEEMEELSRWISGVDPGIPLHLSRFSPHYRMNHKEPTSREIIDELAAIAQSHLKKVYKGNY